MTTGERVTTFPRPKGFTMSTSPLVTFVVPCYNLAHLLPECVRSILGQTYRNIEVLIMDDCSPDDTPAVAASFGDERVKHIRNNPNLGHLRNYNKGIELSQGKYVWLISADDYLRKPYAVERYVNILEANPRVGYGFCPGYGVCDGVETRLLGAYSGNHDSDRIFPGHALLQKLLESNFVLAPSGIVRKECYDRAGAFELNMPWCGDWYLWCLFAVYWDVAYVAEPMVCYREHHPFSMTTQLTAAKLDACAIEEVAVPWIIRDKATAAGLTDLARQSLTAIAHTHARVMASERYLPAASFMNFEQLEDALASHGLSDKERDFVRAQVYASIGDYCYWRSDEPAAKDFYKRALGIRPTMMGTSIKTTLLKMGRLGGYVRRRIVASR